MTPRYLVKTRRLHRQRLQQSAQEAAEDALIVPLLAKVEMEEEDEAGAASSVVIPHSDSE